MTSNQIAALSLIDTQDSIPDNQEYALVVKKTGLGSTPYPIVDITVSTTLQKKITSLADSVWANNDSYNVGEGLEGQEFNSDDNMWKYTCVANNYWTRSLVISNLTDLILGSENDTSGLLTISYLNTTYPNAVPPQRIRGSNGYYERDVAESWFYVATTTLAAN